MEERLKSKEGYIVKRTLALFLLLSFSAQAKIQITAFNIRNYDKKSEQTDKIELKKILTDLGSDLFVVEEIYNNPSFEAFVAKEMPNYKLSLSRCGGGGSQNLAFLYNPSKLILEKTVEDAKISDLDGIGSSDYGCSSLRPAYLGFFKDIETDKNFIAVALHLKAGSGSRNFSKRSKQYKYLLKMIRNLRMAGHKNIVLMGDLNTTGWNKRNEDYKNFANLLNQSGTKTIAEKLECTSYWGGKNQSDDIEVPSVLDHIVYTPDFLGMKMDKASVGTHCAQANCKETYNSVLGNSYSNVSDHCPITAVFK